MRRWQTASRLLTGLAVLAVLAVPAAPAAAQVQGEPIAAEPINTVPEPTGEVRVDRNETILETCRINRPSEVQRYVVKCFDATVLDVEVKDVAAPGDHWQVKAKVWDAAPNTAVATAPGDQDLFGAPARVYNYGGTNASRFLRAEVDCSYLHGVNAFPADGVLRFSTDGTCKLEVTTLPLVDEIYRSP